jgi:hypothetical protein
LNVSETVCNNMPTVCFAFRKISIFFLNDWLELWNLSLSNDFSFFHLYAKNELEFNSKFNWLYYLKPHWSVSYLYIMQKTKSTVAFCRYYLLKLLKNIKTCIFKSNFHLLTYIVLILNCLTHNF